MQWPHFWHLLLESGTSASLRLSRFHTVIQQCSLQLPPCARGGVKMFHQVIACQAKMCTIIPLGWKPFLKYIFPKELCHFDRLWGRGGGRWVSHQLTVNTFYQRPDSGHVVDMRWRGNNSAEDKEQISVRQLQGRQMDSRNPVCHSKLHDFLLMKCIPFLLTIPQVSVHFPGRTIPCLPFFGWSSEGNSHPSVAPPQRAAAWLRLRLTKCDEQSCRPPSESCLFAAVHFFMLCSFSRAVKFCKKASFLFARFCTCLLF